jgi:hypothetical protein
VYITETRASALSDLELENFSHCSALLLSFTFTTQRGPIFDKTEFAFAPCRQARVADNGRTQRERRPSDSLGSVNILLRGSKMAKEVKAPGTGEKVTRLPAGTSVKSLMTDQLGYDEQSAEITKEAGDQLKEYAKDKHIDPWAFRTVKALRKLKSAAMRVARIEHLRHYIDVLKLDEGVSPTLPGTPGAAEGITAEDLETHEAGAADDDHRDFRPRHLRQPGASGADIDDAIKAAGGTGVTPLNPKKRSVEEAADLAEKGNQARTNPDTKH